MYHCTTYTHDSPPAFLSASSISPPPQPASTSSPPSVSCAASLPPALLEKSPHDSYDASLPYDRRPFPSVLPYRRHHWQSRSHCQKLMPHGLQPLSLLPSLPPSSSRAPPHGRQQRPQSSHLRAQLLLVSSHLRAQLLLQPPQSTALVGACPSTSVPLQISRLDSLRLSASSRRNMAATLSPRSRHRPPSARLLQRTTAAAQHFHIPSSSSSSPSSSSSSRTPLSTEEGCPARARLFIPHAATLQATRTLRHSHHPATRQVGLNSRNGAAIQAIRRGEAVSKNTY